MAGETAGLVRARHAAAWLAGSPRVRRLVATQTALLLASGVAGAAALRGLPAVTATPLALVGVDTQRDPAELPAVAVRPARARASRTKARPAGGAETGWAYWAPRIRGCESHGRPDASPDYSAQSPTSTASGGYQILDTTWAGRFGFEHAGDATPAQQEEGASELYRQWGLSIWRESAPCWRAPKAVSGPRRQQRSGARERRR